MGLHFMQVLYSYQLVQKGFSFFFFPFLILPIVNKNNGRWIEEYLVYDRVFGKCWDYSNGRCSGSLLSPSNSICVCLMLLSNLDDFVQIPMTALGVILMDKSGRRPLLLVRRLRNLYQVCNGVEWKLFWIPLFSQVSAAGTCLGCLLAGLSFFLQVFQSKIYFSWILFPSI